MQESAQIMQVTITLFIILLMGCRAETPSVSHLTIVYYYLYCSWFHTIVSIFIFYCLIFISYCLYFLFYCLYFYLYCFYVKQYGHLGKLRIIYVFLFIDFYLCILFIYIEK